MERSQFWIFIGIGLAVGVCLQVMKTPKSPQVKLAGFSRFEALLDEGRQVYIADEPKSSRPMAAVAVAVEEEEYEDEVDESAAAPAVGDSAVSPDGEKKPQTEEEKKKAAEEAKKKKEADDKKKKKKKKKKKPAAVVPPMPENTPIADEEPKKKADEADANAAPMAPLGGARPALAVTPDDGNPKTIREWEDYLLREANFERASKFIKLYQTGAVKPDVFYPVVTTMLDDKRPKVRELAILALGASTSPQSFAMLADTYHTDTDASLRTQADMYLKDYARVDNLRHLVSTLAGSNAVAQYEAVRVARTSGPQNLRTTTPTTTSQTARNARTLATTVRAYTPLMAMLQHASTKATDTTVRTSAAVAVQELQTLLTAAQVAATTPVTPATGS